MVFKSNKQRRAVMAKLHDRHTFLGSLKKALGMKTTLASKNKLIKTYEAEIKADKQLIRAGSDIPHTLVGEALKVTGKIRLHNDQKYLDQLKKSLKAER